MSLAPPIPAEGRKSAVIGAAIIVALCMLVYFHCLSFGITNSDDDVLITKNIAFLRHLPNLSRVFTTDAFYQVKSIDLYRPLQSATFILDAQWGPNLLFVAHLTNLILHVVACLTVFWLLRLLEFRGRIALLGASIYAVHYLFMTAVAWLPARGDLLLAVFTLLAVAYFIQMMTSGGWKNCLLHGIFFTLALYAKESAVVLPALLGGYLVAYGRTSALGRRHFGLALFYLIDLGVYFSLKSRAVILYSGDTGVVPLLKNMRTLPETVAKFCLPLNMSTLPAYTLPATASGILLIAGVVGVHLLMREKFDRRVFFYAGWFLLFLMPGMLYYPAFYDFAYEHMDHRAYVSGFGLLLLTLNIVQTLDGDRKKLFPAACVALLVYLAACNVHFSRSYRNPAEFALRAIRTNPKSADAYSIYGTELFLAGRDDEALANLNRSIGIFSKYTPALQTRALIYRKRGLFREALADLDTMIAFDSGADADIYLLRAETKIELEDFAGARTDFAEALKLRPGSAAASRGLDELQRTVRNDRVLPAVRAARDYNRRGLDAGGRRDFTGAESFFRMALELDPELQGVNLNLGNVLFDQGRIDEACGAWSLAARKGDPAPAELFGVYCGRRVVPH